MLALLAQLESAGALEGSLFLLMLFAAPAVLVLLPVFIGLGVFARRRSNSKMERIATVGSLICFMVLLGFALLSLTQLTILALTPRKATDRLHP